MTQWRRGYLQRPSSTLIPDPTQPTLLSPDPPCFFQSSSSVSNTPSQTAPSAPSPSPPSNLVYQPDAENPADHILSRLPPRRCHLKFCHLCRWSVYLLHPFSSLSLTESFILSGNQLQICVYLILYQHFSRYLLPLTSSSSRKQGPDQPETSGPALKSQRTKMSKSEDTEKKNKKLKDAEICVPIVYGNVAFWLGKKASEYQSHKWTVYVRGASNEDLSAVIRRAVFQLHSSFNNPTRVVEAPPFELSESGWGEFEIAITLFFHNDVCDKPLNLFHHLKLYPEEDSGPMSTKKPVVVESYDEIVFPEPSESLLGRLQNHPAITLPRLPSGYNLPPVAAEEESKKKRGDTKDHPLSQWFLNFSEADELLQLAAARQQVQAHIAKLKRQISLLDGQQQQQQQQLRSTSEQ